MNFHVSLTKGNHSKIEWSEMFWKKKWFNQQTQNSAKLIFWSLLFFELRLIVFKIYRWHTGIFKCVTNQKKIVQKWSNLQKRCAILKIHWKIDQFWVQISITQKLKIGKLIFHSFQLIAHIFCKFDHFWTTFFWLVTHLKIPVCHP